MDLAPALVVICSDPAEVRDLLAPSANLVELWSPHDASLRTWIDPRGLAAPHAVPADTTELVIRLPLDGPAESVPFALEWIADHALSRTGRTVAFVSPPADEPPSAAVLRAVARAGLCPGADVRTCLRSIADHTIWVPGVHGLARLTMPPEASPRDLAQILTSLVPTPDGSPIPDRLHALVAEAAGPSDPAWCTVLAAAYIESILETLSQPAVPPRRV